jgi:hypothetical protein
VTVRQFSVCLYSTQCRDNFLAEGCVMSLALMFYGPSAFLSIDDYVIIGQTWPASVATRNMDHWAQVGWGELGCAAGEGERDGRTHRA